MLQTWPMAKLCRQHRSVLDKYTAVALPEICILVFLDLFNADSSQNSNLLKEESRDSVWSVRAMVAVHPDIYSWEVVMEDRCIGLTSS